MNIIKTRTLIIIAILSSCLSFAFWKEDPEEKAQKRIIEYFEGEVGEKVEEIRDYPNKVAIKTFE